MTDISKIDMNRIEGLLSLLESIDYVVESKLPTAEDPTWYRLYKSGWVEQGGWFISTNGYTHITYSKTMLDTNYNIFLTGSDNIANATTVAAKLHTSSKTTTSIDVCQTYNDVTYLQSQLYWQVSGQSA